VNIWFVFGVSGAGKSHFSEYAAGHLGFFHYEIDQTPHDGIAHFGLRKQWDAFIDETKADPLVKELTKRACVSGCPGAILSFPSNLLSALKQEHVEALRGKVTFVILTGEPEFCKREFLKRERQTGRNYSASVWEANNRGLYEAMRHEWLEPHLVPVFTKEGHWRSVEELVNVVSEVI